MPTQNPDRVIQTDITVEAGVDEVWQAWTTESGIKTFFAPACNVELRVGGPYEIFFNPEAEPGLRGGEGNQVLAFQLNKMMSFTWNAPPHLPNVRPQRTYVMIRFTELAPNQTQVTLTHDGWGEGVEWDQAFAYFSRAWPEIVLPRLKYRFDVGPVDWESPPQLNAN
jgi:uncharacterized protein YndB with AHSA1/START domain